jgi:restriction endonuclease S subunit
MMKERNENWKVVSFNDVLDYIQPTKYIVKSTEYDAKFKTPVLTAGKSFIKGYTNEETGIYNSLPVIIFDDFTTATKFVNFPFKVKSSAMKILKPKELLADIKFAYYLMQTINVNKDTHKRYWISVYSKLKVNLPPPHEQLAIVSKIEELFSELNKGVENLKLAQQQLKTYRQSVLKWAFEGKLSEPGFTRLNDEHDELTSKKSSKALNPINYGSDNLPKGWRLVKLEEVCEIKRGKSKHRPRNEPSLYGGKYPFIQTGDIRNANGGYINEFSQTYSELGLQQSKLWPKGTLCITIAANIGETAILNFDACFPDSVVGLLPKTEVILNKYMNYFFIYYKQRLEELAPATAQKNINVDILEKLELPLCSVEEQNQIIQEIESRLSVADKIEESITQSLQQSQALRQSILKRAFEGQLVIEKKEEVFKPKNVYFYQMQVLALIAKASKQKQISHGEMTLAKYAYLADKIYHIPTHYNFQRLHLGPYPKEMKKAINNKKYFKIKSQGIEIVNENELLKYVNPYQDQIENAVDALTEIFSKFPSKERSHKTELLATVCKVIEDIKSTDLALIRQSMQDWKIDLKTTSYKTKAEKFTEKETKDCIGFIVKKGWDKKLLN